MTSTVSSSSSSRISSSWLRLGLLDWADELLKLRKSKLDLALRVRLSLLLLEMPLGKSGRLSVRSRLKRRILRWWGGGKVMVGEARRSSRWDEGPRYIRLCD